MATEGLGLAIAIDPVGSKVLHDQHQPVALPPGEDATCWSEGFTGKLLEFPGCEKKWRNKHEGEFFWDPLLNSHIDSI